MDGRYEGWYSVGGRFPRSFPSAPAAMRFQLREFQLAVSNRVGNIVYTNFS